MKEVFINLENNKFQGEVLDVSSIDNTIIRELCVDKIQNERIIYKDKNIKKSIDTSVLFFSLNLVNTGVFKYKMIKTIHNMMNKNAEIYIWDINKPRNKVFRKNIKMLLPNKTIKNLKINNLNLINDNSFERIRDLIASFFEIREIRTSDDVFFIKAIKN